MLVVDVYKFTYQNLSSVDSVPTPTHLINEYHSMGIPTQYMVTAGVNGDAYRSSQCNCGRVTIKMTMKGLIHLQPVFGDRNMAITSHHHHIVLPKTRYRRH